MKNYKLDVVRYNNEDVIATSGSTIDTINNGDFLYYVVQKEPVLGYLWVYENGNFVEVAVNVTIPVGLSAAEGKEDMLEAGNYYHVPILSNEMYSCNHDGHHGANLPE